MVIVNMCHVHMPQFKAIEGKHLTQSDLEIKIYGVK